MAVGYFFMSGFGPRLGQLCRTSGMERVRILVGHVDKPVVEQVAHGLQQAEALRMHSRSANGLVRRSEREEGVRRGRCRGLAKEVSLLPQRWRIGKAP